MIVAVDVNILVYASDAGCPDFAPARAFLDDLLDGSDLLCLTWPTIAGYLRVTTSPVAMRQPLDTAEATFNVNLLLERTRTRVLMEEPGFWEVYRELLVAHRARTKLVHDVHLASLLKQHGVRRLYTRDRDFRRFDFLEVVDPLAA